MDRHRIIVHTGTTSLIMIFGVLALVTFGALSLSSAGAGWRLAEKMAERTADYYGAEARAMERLVQVEGQLREACRESTPETYEASVKKRLEGMEQTRWEKGCVCWEEPIQEGQVLAVAVRPVYAAAPDEAVYEIEIWETREEGQWQNEQPLKLYGGEEKQGG